MNSSSSLIFDDDDVCNGNFYSLSRSSQRALSLSLSLAAPTIYIEKNTREEEKTREGERRRARGACFCCVCGEIILKQNKQKRERDENSLFYSPRSCWETRPSPKKVKKRFPYVRIYRRPSSLSRVWLRFAFLLPKMKKRALLFLCSLSLSLHSKHTYTLV